MLVLGLLVWTVDDKAKKIVQRFGLRLRLNVNGLPNLTVYLSGNTEPKLHKNLQGFFKAKVQLHIMASAGVWAYSGLWGLALNVVQGQSPWWEVRRSPPEADEFWANGTLIS